MLGVNGVMGQNLLESFTDGDFTSSPVWVGNTTLWAIQSNSDAAAGASSSNTLRLAGSGTATDYLSTQISSWGTSQEWGFWVGRRAQAFTAANQMYIWLYANESTLNNATVDGYRIAIGDDSGGDDIRLEYIVNGAVSATVIASAGSITNTITDIGFLIRVTRSSSGAWEVFTSTLPTSTGNGAIATTIPNNANASTSQGTGTNNTLAPASNGYFGVAALHSASANALATVEIDQIYFTPRPQALPYTQNFGTSAFSEFPGGFQGFTGINGTTVNSQATALSTLPTSFSSLTSQNGTFGSEPAGGLYGYSTSSNGRLCVATSNSTTLGLDQPMLLINTGSGVTSISVSYDVEVLYAASGYRTMGIEFEYRAGTSGSWTSVSGSTVSYTAGGSTPTGTTSKSLTISGLTASTDYQLRWASWRDHASGTTNMSIGLDNVSITSTPAATDYYWNGNGGSPLSANFNTGPWSTSASTSAALTWPASGATNVANFSNAQGGTVTMPASYNSAPSNVVLGSAGYTFSTAASTPSTLSSTINLGANALTLSPNATSAALTLSGIISGTGGSLVSNTGTSILSGTNTFTGGVTLSSGQLNINNAAALGTTAGTFAISGGTIDNTSGGSITTSNYPQTWGGDFAFTGTNALNLGTGTVALGASASRTVTANASTLTIGGIISGSSSSLTKAGNGTLALSGANTFNGGLNINAGTVSLAASNVLADAGSVTVNGGILNSAGAYTDSIGALTLTSGSITGSTGTLNPSSISVSSGTIDAIIGGGAAAMTKNTSGTVFLTNAINSYAGGTTINGGILSVNGANRVGGTAVGVTINAGTFQLTTTSITSARAFNFNNSASTFDVASGIKYTNTTGTFTGSGILNKTGSGILTFQTSNSNAQTYNGLNIKGGTVSIGKETDLGSVPGSTNASYLLFDDGTLLDSNTITIDSKRGIVLGTGGGTINVLSTKTATYGGIIADNSGAGSLIKTGAGILTLTGTANSYTGSTTITAGELRLNPIANATFASQIVLNGGTLSTTSITGTRTFTSSSTLNLAASSTIALGGNAHTLTFANSSSVSWAGTTLTITGWIGTAGSTGTAGQIFVGAGGLTSAQLAKINFSGYSNGAMIVAGELLPFVSSSPTISTSGTLSAVSTTYGTATASPTSFTASGINLTADISISAPSGYEISQTVGGASGYATTQTLIQSSGTISSTTIYVRLAASSVVGSYTGNIQLTSTGADTVNVATVSSSVGTATLTITNLSPSNKTYDGTNAVVTGTAQFNNLKNGESFTPNSITWTFPDKNVGTAKVLTKSGTYSAPSSNYTVTQPTLTADISALPLTTSGSASITTKQYDRTTTATVTSLSLTNVVSGDVVNIVGTYNDKTVNTGKAVTISLSGADIANYTWSAPTGVTGNITTATLTITSPAAVSKSYDGTTAATITGSLSGVISGDAVTLNGTGTFASSTVGTGIAVTSTSTLSGADAANYTLTQPTGLTADITATPSMYIYRTLRSGNWNGITSGSETWERSSNGGTSYSTVTISGDLPSSSNSTITIQNGHTVTITATVTVDEVTVQNGGILTVSAAMTVNNGTGDDISIESGGRVNYTVSTFSYNASSNIRIKTGGILSLQSSGITGSSAAVHSTSHVYEDASILEWNLGSATPSASGVTYFPNVTTEIPIFRFAVAPNGSIGGASSTTINGRVELASGVSISWSGAGAKTFRNGIVGLGGANVMSGTTSSWNITGTTAQFGTNGGTSLTLTNSAGINISSSTTATLVGNLNTGASTNLTVAASGGVLDAASFQLIASGASATFTINGKLKTSKTEGLNGSSTTAISSSNTPTVTLGASSTIEYTSASAQTITPRSYVNLTISGAGMKSVAAGNNQIIVTGTLTTGGLLTLKSDATGTASIGSSGTITGNVTVERYISGSGRKYRFLSSPVSAATISNWMDSIWVTGPGDSVIANRVNGSTLGTTNTNGWHTSIANINYPTSGGDIKSVKYTSIRAYDETATANNSNIDSGFANVSTSQSLTPGQGFKVFVRGPRKVGGIDQLNQLGATGSFPSQNAVTLSLTGTVNQGDIVLNGSTNTAYKISKITQGWNLIGNPYPCAYNLVAHYTGNSNSLGSNLNTTIYIYNATTGGYHSYNANGGTAVGSGLSAGIIPSGSAFFIQASSASPVFTFKETYKTSTAPGVLHKTDVKTDQFEIKYYKDSVESDYLTVKVYDGATLDYDMYDIYKFRNDNINLSAYGQDTVQLAATVIPQVTEETHIKLNVEARAIGTYKFDFINMDNFDKGVTVSLFDRYTNKTTNIGANSIYTFDMGPGENQWGKNRFELILNGKATSTNPEDKQSTIINTKMAVYPNPASDVLNISINNASFKNSNLSIFNISGNEVLNTTMNGASAQLNIESLSNGVYFVKVKNENGFDRTVKFIK
jgi:autotransporter-associated beta strand protein